MQTSPDHYYVGRGTTALWLALQGLLSGSDPSSKTPPEVILPDLLCSVAADAVLLAGAVPRFATVSADRFTLSAEGVEGALTPNTRAILVAHLYGHGADVPALRTVAPSVPILEDAVQGIGGRVEDQPIGTLGDVSIISYHPTKMIDGRGGVLRVGVTGVRHRLHTVHESFAAAPVVDWARVRASLRALPTLPASAAHGYLMHLQVTYRTLLIPFDPAPQNVACVQTSLATLPERVCSRNAKARWLHEKLVALSDAVPGLQLPTLRAGDAIWRYTFAAPSRLLARRLIHALGCERLLATALYPSLSQVFGGAALTPFADRLINVWVDETATDDYLCGVVQTIRRVLLADRP